MKIDGSRAYYFRFNTFSFDETRYANAHIDYEEEALHDATIQRCYRLPGNKLSMDANPDLNGELILSDGTVHNAEIIVTDFAGNSGSIYISLQSTELSLAILTIRCLPMGASIVNEIKGININTEDIHLRIPAGAVYDETWFTFSKSSGSKKFCFSLCITCGERGIAVQKSDDD